MDISPYRGLCGLLVSLFKWVPVLVISGIVAWSYYAYVAELCIKNVESDVMKVILLVGYHVVITLFLASYWRTVWTRPGDIPKRFRLTADELDSVEGSEDADVQKRLLEQIVIDKDLPVAMRTIQGAVRYCEKCVTIKPDRAHHCSVCGTCVLKMDHHCPWVNNCVAFNNYKFFVLFLMYGLVYCLYVALTSLKYFLQFWRDVGGGGGGSEDGDQKTEHSFTGGGQFHILFLFFVSAMFSISLCSLLGYHVHLVLHNRTTLEAFRAPVFRRGPDKDGFSLGKRGNLSEVFGDDCWSLLLPVFSSFGDGLTFPQRFSDDLETGNCNTGNGTGSHRWTGVGGWGWQSQHEESVPMLAHVGDEEEEEEEERLDMESWRRDLDGDTDSEEEVLLDTAVLPSSNSVSPARDFVNVTIDS